MKLGVTKTQRGYRFAFANEKEEPCSLLIYQKGEKLPELEIPMTHAIGTVYVAETGKLNAKKHEYVYRVGDRLVLDPYATGITGKRGFGNRIDREELRCTFSAADYDWGEDHHPEIPFSDSLIYCTHVRGFTMDPSSKVRAKGTFRGIMEKIPYLVSLGICQLELMPVYEFEEFPREKKKSSVYERELPKEDLKLNYWGYSEGFYFAPKASYAYGQDPERELKDLVRALHKAGIELILEFYFQEDTAPHLVMDCIRYWVETYHIDGVHINRSAISMKALIKDPVLKSVKIFTEYFESSELLDETRNPKRRHLAEYHDGFMIDARHLLRGDEASLRNFTERARKNPECTGVVNYMANHNGFTMMDMVSYDEKHNEANGENNRDGSDYNVSWNCGMEGATGKRAVKELRSRQLRNAFAMVLLSQGIPLIYGGDECCNSQQGNNNVYGQDNRMSWIQWNRTKQARELTEYVRELIAFRKAHPTFHGERESKMSDHHSTGLPDLSYHGESAWYGGFEAYRRHVGVLYGPYVEKNELYVAYNFHSLSHEFGLPTLPKGKVWKKIFQTTLETVFTPGGEKLENQRQFILEGRSICVLEGMTDE